MQPDVCLFMAFLNTLITFENQRQFQESRARNWRFFYEGSQEGYQWRHCCVDWRHFFLKKVPNRKVLSDTNWNGFSCRQKQQWSHYYFFISAPNANDSTDDVDYDFQPSLFQTPRRAVLEVAWEGTHSKDVMWSSHFLSDWVELHHHHHHSHSHHWRDQCHLL